MKKLKTLRCSDCKSLTSIPFNSLEYEDHDRCTWIDHEIKDKNIEKLKRLQSFTRKNFKYWLFKRWSKSREGIEWLYDPKRIGGLCVKRRMDEFFSLPSKTMVELSYVKS